jgi:cation diffusion facilitator family transporter
MQVGLVYLIVSLVVLALKTAAAITTKSTALYSDALETLVNIAAAIISLIVLKFISQPKDENHPYGHGKAEFISSAVEGGFVLSAGLAIFIEASRNLASPKAIEFNNLGLTVSCIATALNVGLALYLRKASQNRHSVMLNASSVHVLSDVWTTVGVLLALGITRITGYPWIDPLIALVLSVFLFHEGYKVLREAFSGLTDELDPKILNELSIAFQKVVDEGEAPGLIDLHAVRFIRSGNFHHVDAHLVVPRFWDVSRTHIFMEELEEKVVKAYRFDGEIAFHIDPCEAADCASCDYPNCPVRSQAFVKRKSFTPERVAGEKKMDKPSTYRQNP